MSLQLCLSRWIEADSQLWVVQMNMRLSIVTHYECIFFCVKIIIQSFAFKGYGGGGGGYQMRSWNLRVPRCCHPGHWSSLVSPTLNEAQDMGKTEKTAVSPRCFATQCFPQTSLHVHWFCFNCFINLEAFLSLWKKTNPSCQCQCATELLWPRTVSVMQGKGKYDRDHGRKRRRILRSGCFAQD